MSTLLIRALDFWELFLNKPLWKFPVYCDRRDKALKSIRLWKAHLKSYYLGESLLIFIGAGCSMLVILKQVLFPSSTISLFQLIVLGVATCLTLSTALFSFGYLINRKYLTSILGAVLEIEYNLKTSDNETLAGEIIDRDNNNVDYIGYILTVFRNGVVGLAVLSPGIIPIVCFFRSNPLFHIFQLIFSNPLDNDIISTDFIHLFILGIRISLIFLLSVQKSFCFVHHKLEKNLQCLQILEL